MPTEDEIKNQRLTELAWSIDVEDFIAEFTTGVKECFNQWRQLQVGNLHWTTRAVVTCKHAAVLAVMNFTQNFRY